MAKVNLEKEMAKMVAEGAGGKFFPHLFYHESSGILQVILRNCSIYEARVTTCFEVFRDNRPRKKQGSFVGFSLWNVRGMLRDQGYKRSSISLEHLIKRYGRYYKPSCYERNVFGKYEKKILKIARKHQFVWHFKEDFV